MEGVTSLVEVEEGVTSCCAGEDCGVRRCRLIGEDLFSRGEV